MHSNSDGWNGPYWIDIVVLLTWAAAATAVSQVFGPTSAAGNVASLLGVVGALLLVLFLRRIRREPWSCLGLARPADWGKVVAIAIPIAVLFVALSHGAEVLVIRPLFEGDQPDLSRFNPLKGNLGALVTTLVAVWFSAALAEEIIFRGFLMGRVAVLLGGTRSAWVGSLFLVSALFGALHVYQGITGVLTTGFAGLMLGALYLFARRDLWLVILVHGLMNTIALTLIYLGWA